MNKKSILDFILKKEKENKIIFCMLDGLVEQDIDDFIKQPAEGILFDLNRDKITCISWLRYNDCNPIWVNNYAVALTIERLKQKIKKLEEIENGIGITIKEWNDMRNENIELKEKLAKYEVNNGICTEKSKMPFLWECDREKI